VEELELMIQRTIHRKRVQNPKTTPTTNDGVERCKRSKGTRGESRQYRARKRIEGDAAQDVFVKRRLTPGSQLPPFEAAKSQ
jgi:hypothetical protein